MILEPSDLLRVICRGGLAGELSEHAVAPLMAMSTSAGSTLESCVRSGVEHPESEIGIYAGDAECYELFESVFGAVIQHHHGTADHHNTPVEVELPATRPEVDIRSSRVRVARSLADFPFPTMMSEADFLAVEANVVDALDASLGGEYHPIDTPPQGPVPMMHNRDPFLRSAGSYAHWPRGRGIYLSDGLVIWINEEDHLRIQALKRGYQLENALRLVQKAERVLVEAGCRFAEHPQFGFLNSCPTNCGSGMRISVHARLGPQPSAVMESLISSRGLDIRPEGGEGGKRSQWWDLSNSQRLGLDENQLLRLTMQALAAIPAQI